MSHTHMSSKRQEASKDKEKKWQSEDPVKLNSRFEVTQHLTIVIKTHNSFPPPEMPGSVFVEGI